MTPPMCPKCSGEGRHLPVSSDHYVADYFRCIKCAHVWCFIRGDKLQTPIDVTQLPPPNRTM